MRFYVWSFFYDIFINRMSRWWGFSFGCFSGWLGSVVEVDELCVCI